MSEERTSRKGRFTSRLRDWRWWAVTVVAALGVWGYLPTRPLSPHSGDGEFADTTVRGRLCVGGPSLFDFRGYSVTMPGFDLAADYRAEYRVSGLPDIGRDCTLYLRIDEPEATWMARDEKQRRLRAWLRLEVAEEGGRVVRLDEGRLGEWRWGFAEGQHLLYKLHGSTVRPARGQAYVIRVTYTGDEALAGLQGRCSLACGPRP